MRGKKGAVGVLFKLELKPYGYTFMANGTPSNCLASVENEGRIYTRLEALQGQRVPVYLGLVRLERGYVLPGDRRMVHMMLMSWAGERAAGVGLDEERFKEERRYTSDAVWAQGVCHNDEHGANFLWSWERNCLVLINFSHANLRPAPHHRQLIDSKEGKKRQARSSKPRDSKRPRFALAPLESFR
ncbi:hypothetical protein S40288_09478 [Stachybotrys chartarum IBT 40288]|nr:hypothetical protein S40288_09478 [Stachybotrys chartarum IBT 40288]